MDKKIVVCGCTDFGYEIVDFLLTNGVNISHLVSLSPEQAIQYKVSISALRPHPQKTTHMPRLVISYESPEYYFWSAYSEFGKFLPNFYLNLSKNNLDEKINVLNMYSTQMREGQRGGESLISLARIRGNEIGLDFAEAFHIHRFYM